MQFSKYLSFPNTYRDIISTDEDPDLRIESFAIIKLRGVTTKFKIPILFCILSLYPCQTHFRLGPRINIVTDDQRELAKRNNHVISTPFKMMYIMADLSLDDR